MISVESLKESGAFAGAPVKREVTWESGGGEHTADVYVRKLSYHAAVGDIHALTSDGDVAASRIAACIVDESGNPVFEISDITGVNDDGTPVLDDDGQERGGMVSSLVMALLTVIGEVNRLGKTGPETSDL